MLGNYTSPPDPFGVDLLSSVIQRGLCGVRERNGAVGIAPPLSKAPASVAYLDPTTSFFGVYDGHGGKVAAKFCTRSSLTSGRTKRILLVILKHLYKRCLPEWMKLNEGFIWFPRGPTSELLDV
ncbi:putative PPM-type phosphatase, divalent cation binding, PPM-type phosphatase domain superfamily [Helianthus annuus]|nr:putative PPM-type phosphatase, divalent cation binding, PPM-type phosphatase domain superfamily [Helianthus annuus]